MAGLNISLQGDEWHFVPGEQVRGVCAWDLDRDADAVEVRLFWRTEGKGTTDVAIADTARFESAGFRGERQFTFRLPEGPYSFSGKLVSLVWGLEGVVEPKGPTAEAIEIVVSPTRQEVILHVDSDGEQEDDAGA